MSEIKSERKRDMIRRKLKRLTEKDILTAMKETIDSGYEMFKQKMADYGIGVFKLSGGMGIVVKIREKYARFENLMAKGEDPECESIRDTVRDLAWYSLTLLSMIDEEVVDIDELKEQYKIVFPEDVVDEIVEEGVDVR